VEAYLQTAIDNDFQRFAKAMARHESFSGGHYYNQFNEGAGLHEQPFLGDNGRGWGIAQIDMRLNEPTDVVWDWKANLRKMNAVLQEKRAVHFRFAGYYRTLHWGQSYWTEPPALHSISGISLPSDLWAAIVLYNGADGIPGFLYDGITRYPPWQFKYTTQGQWRWDFYDNNNAYAECIAEEIDNLENSTNEN